jgi:hypothetical protein
MDGTRDMELILHVSMLSVFRSGSNSSLTLNPAWMRGSFLFGGCGRCFEEVKGGEYGFEDVGVTFRPNNFVSVTTVEYPYISNLSRDPPKELMFVR